MTRWQSYARASGRMRALADSIEAGNVGHDTHHRLLAELCSRNGGSAKLREDAATARWWARWWRIVAPWWRLSRGAQGSWEALWRQRARLRRAS